MASGLCLRFGSRIRSTFSQFSVGRGSPFIAFLESPLLITSPSANLPVTPVEFPFSTPGLRYLSTLRRQPDRKRSVDIGARARQLQNRRLWTYALTFSCVAGFIVIVLNNFQDQLVFYVTPSDAMEKYSTNPSKNKFRLGGLVLEGSVTQPASSPEMEFVVTDLITDILVRYQGSLPDLFREGHSAIVEGFVRPFTDETREKFASAGKPVSAKAWSGDCYFAATEVLAKHDEKYMPQEVAAAIERNKAKLEAGCEQETVRNIIHNWRHDDCLKLLKNCYEALPEHGKVVVIDMVVPLAPETTTDAKAIFRLDLCLLAQFLGGKERTMKEFENLTQEAGFLGFKLFCSVLDQSVIEFYKNRI